MVLFIVLANIKKQVAQFVETIQGQHGNDYYHCHRPATIWLLKYFDYPVVHILIEIVNQSV